VANASVTDTCALVLYSRDDGSVIWSSGTSCKSPPPPPPPPPSPAPPLPPPTPVDCTTIRDKVVAGYQVRAHRSASSEFLRNACVHIACCCLLLVCHCQSLQSRSACRHTAPPHPTPPPLLKGWFGTPEGPVPGYGWWHWAVKSGPPGPGNSQFDLFPGGLSEYPSGSLHPTNLLWDNGSAVSLYDNAADGVSVLHIYLFALAFTC
jgi:hypothetical protein